MRVRLDRRYRISAAAISAAIVVVIGSGQARGQSAEAQAWFDRGIRMFEAHELDDACDAFERASRIEPDAGTLSWLGACREQNHQLASAAAAYRDALARARDPRKRAFAQQRAAALVPRLSQLTLIVADDGRLDGLTIKCDDRAIDGEQWNRPIPIDGGVHVILAQATGYDEWRITTQVPVESGQVRIEVPRLVAARKPEPLAPPGPIPVADAAVPGPATPAAARPAAAAGGSATQPAAPSPGAPAAVHASLVTARRAVGLGVAGAGVAAAVIGAVVGNSARQKQSDALRLCPGGASCDAADAANAAIRAAQHRALEANLAFGFAAAATVAAGVLWITGGPDPEGHRRVSIVPDLASGRAGLVVAGRL
jgi:hypothetical protein